MLDVVDHIDNSFKINCYASESLEKCNSYFTTKHTFKALTFNIRSLQQNFDYFVVSLTRVATIFDVIVLTECWLNGDTIIPQIPGYSSYCTKKYINKSGGVTAYVRNVWRTVVTEPDIIDCNCLKILINEQFLILGIYRSPSFKQLDPFLLSVDSFLQQNSNNTECVMWLGDLNLDLLSDPLSVQGTDYLCLAAEHELISAISLPTRNKACLDHIFIKKGFEAVGIVCSTDITDHDICMIGLGISSKPKPTQARTRLRIDYAAVQEDLKNTDWISVLSKTDVNQAVDEFHHILSSVISKHSLYANIGRSQFNLKPWITPGLIRCQKNRDTLHLKAKKYPNNKLAQITYKRYRNFYKELLRRVKTQYEKAELFKYKNNMKKMWQTINNICDNCKIHAQPMELIDNHNDPIEALNNCNNYFANVGHSLAAKILDNLKVTEQSLALAVKPTNSSLNSFFLTPTDCVEVDRLIAGLKLNSSPGLDGYTTNLIKHVRYSILLPLTFILNLSLEYGVFPDRWKLAVVIPIYKEGAKDAPSNYRPISLLSVFSKLLEKIVNIRLVRYIEDKQLLSDKQFGFRRGRSVEDAVVLLTNTVSAAVDQNLKCIGVFLDLAKAFDTVSIPILSKKLQALGVRGLALNWFLSYLSSRRQCVRIGSSLSSESLVCFGVPQGSILGPTLFSVYMNDVLELSIPGADVICYADDTVVIFRDTSWDKTVRLAESGMQQISAWLDSNLLTLNTKKTKFITFYKSSRSLPKIDIRLQIHSCAFRLNDVIDCQKCESIGQVNTIRYLGIELDEALTFKNHVKKLSGRVRKLIYIMKSLRHACDKSTLLMVYCSLCQSIISFGILAWGGACKTVLIELEKAQRAVLKVMLGKPFRFPTDLLYKETEVLRVRQIYILKAVIATHKKLVNSKEFEDLTQKRVFRVPVPAIKSAFANRHPAFLLPRTYNKICKIFDIKREPTSKVKRLVRAWLLCQTYSDTENLIYL